MPHTGNDLKRKLEIGLKALFKWLALDTGKIHVFSNAERKKNNWVLIKMV